MDKLRLKCQETILPSYFVFSWALHIQKCVSNIVAYFSKFEIFLELEMVPD